MHTVPRAKGAVYLSPLRLEVIRLTEERNPSFDGPSLLKVTSKIEWEPRLVPIEFTQESKEIDAVDERGEALGVLDTMNVRPPIATTQAQVAIRFKAPQRSVEKIASLKGKLHCSVLGKPETFEFAKLSEAAAYLPLVQKKQSVSVTLDKVAKNNDLWEVGIRLHFDDVSADSNLVNGWIMQNEAYLIGPDGKRIDNAGFHHTQTDNEFGVVYQFELPASGVDGCTFVYKTFSGVRSLSFDYELKDLTLP